MKVRLWRRVNNLVVELLLPDQPPRLWRNINISLSQYHSYRTWVILCHDRSNTQDNSDQIISLMRAYLQIKHPYEVGALRIVFDEAHHSGVLQAPRGWTVRQSHEQLCHCRGHGLNTLGGKTEHFLLKLTCKCAVLWWGFTSLFAFICSW